MPKNYRKRRAEEEEDEAPAGGAGDEDLLPPEVLRCAFNSCCASFAPHAAVAGR